MVKTFTFAHISPSVLKIWHYRGKRGLSVFLLLHLDIVSRSKVLSSPLKSSCVAFEEATHGDDIDPERIRDLFNFHLRLLLDLRWVIAAIAK